MRRMLEAFVGLGLIVSDVGYALAEVDVVRAAELVAEAETAYQTGDPALAAQLYQRAYGHSADPQILLILAHIYDQAVNDHQRAVVFYELFLATRPVNAEATRQELEAAQRRLEQADLHILVEPAGLMVRLGSHEMEAAPEGSRFAISPGELRLEVFEGEDVRFSETLRVEPGRNQVQVHLPESAPEPPRPKTLAWTLTGASVGTGLAWGLLATWAQIEQDRQLAGAADVMLGVAALSTTGAILAWVLE